MKELLSINEFCNYFNITRQTFYNWKKDNIIKDLIKINRKVFIPSKEVERIINDRRRGE